MAPSRRVPAYQKKLAMTKPDPAIAISRCRLARYLCAQAQTLQGSATPAKDIPNPMAMSVTKRRRSIYASPAQSQPTQRDRRLPPRLLPRHWVPAQTYSSDGTDSHGVGVCFFAGCDGKCAASVVVGSRACFGWSCLAPSLERMLMSPPR